jgi:hypothetical protein
MKPLLHSGRSSASRISPTTISSETSAPDSIARLACRREARACVYVRACMGCVGCVRACVRACVRGNRRCARGACAGRHRGAHRRLPRPRGARAESCPCCVRGALLLLLLLLLLSCSRRAPRARAPPVRATSWPRLLPAACRPWPGGTGSAHT